MLYKLNLLNLCTLQSTMKPFMSFPLNTVDAVTPALKMLRLFFTHCAAVTIVSALKWRAITI